MHVVASCLVPPVPPLLNRPFAALLLAPSFSEPAHFSTLEISLLLACVLVSAAVFFWRFAPILRNILRSKKDQDLSLQVLSGENLAPRIGNFFWEVLCQAKVIRQRPLPGLLHAFVFWGFLAFALVSLNHFAVGLGIGFLSPASYLGGFYFLFAALWALLVAISITGLFVRRFVDRPIWLGKKVSYESALIAFLIFLLMVTYLGAFFIPETSPALKALWWTHTLTLLLFLPLIPHTKHLHLVLSPLTVFLKRDGFSKIPPLVDDEDYGLVSGKDLTQLISLQAYSCVECGRCTEHCPASNTGKVLNPKEIILGTRTYLNTFGPHSDTPLLVEALEDSPDNPPARYMSMEAAFECTTCGACEFQCPVGIQHLPILIGLRRGAANTGAWEDPYGTKLFLALEKSGNALGLSAMERDKFITKQGFPIFDGTQEYCLWLGCMGGYDPKGREIIADFARIMDHLGTTFGVLKKEKCTGDPARRLGNDLVFQNLAEAGLKSFEAAKVQKIVAICPHCVRTIATDWRAYGIAPEIEHHSEFLGRHQSLLPNRSELAAASEIPAPAGSGKIAFHDPCYLGRYQDIYEQPRAVVSLAGELVEAPRNHERSFCCGAGGGLAFLGEETATGDAEPIRISHVRAKELIDTGAQTIGTACPFCNTMFRDALVAITPAGQAPPQLLDIAQLTARNLPPKALPPQ
ncbi:MAG TPA: (Fe-S)-binding protein [Granulicella sp.]|nr:(Fe-S)-binding protein [Granulicella sp.]